MIRVNSSYNSSGGRFDSETSQTERSRHSKKQSLSEKTKESYGKYFIKSRKNNIVSKQKHVNYSIEQKPRSRDNSSMSVGRYYDVKENINYGNLLLCNPILLFPPKISSCSSQNILISSPGSFPTWLCSPIVLNRHHSPLCRSSPWILGHLSQEPWVVSSSSSA